MLPACHADPATVSMEEPRRARSPTAQYTDSEVFEQERERLFARTWQYMGHLGDLAEPGSY